MPRTSPDRAASRDDALALHRAGKIPKAIRLYQAILEKDPKNADVLGLIGMAHYQLGNRSAGRTAWRESLSHRAKVPVMLRNLNNLLTAYRQKNTADDLKFLSDLQIPDWPLKTTPDQGERDMIISLARGLLRIGRNSAALKLLESVLKCIADDTRFVKNAAEIIFEAGNGERAGNLLESLAPIGGAVDGEFLILQSAAAFASGKREAAIKFTENAVEALPVYITSKVVSQILLLGVLNAAPKLIDKNMSPQLLHFSKNSPANLAWKYNDVYRFLSILPEASTARAALEKFPKPDLILNNWVNAENLSTPDVLEFISEFADGLGLPVLNHPRHAALTTRQRNSERLAGIPNLVVPRLVRFISDAQKQNQLVRALGATIGFPVIVRNPFMQMGKGTAKLDSPEQLETYLNEHTGQELYAIAFVHNPVADGIFRKFRAAVIGEEIIIYHYHFGQEWNVHGERDQDRRAAIPVKPAIVQFTEKIIANPSESLGEPGMTALREIRNRTPLDFFGIDFDIMPDGKLLFFEANAAMNISLTGRKNLEAPRAIMRVALRRLFEDTRDGKYVSKKIP